MLIDVRPDLLEITQDILHEFLSDCTVYAFGSRANWTAKDTSDLDLCVKGKKAIPLALIEKVKDAFSLSKIPYKVDVVDYHRISESFRKLIEPDLKIVYEPVQGNKIYDLKNKKLASCVKAGLADVSLGLPSNWELLPLKEAGVILIDCDHRTPISAKTGRPYIAIPQLKGGRIDLSEVRHISSEDFATWTKKARPQSYDVILSRRCNPGETAFIEPNFECALGQNLVLLRADGSKVYPPYLRWLARGNDWWNQVHTFLNVGAVFNSLKCADIPNFKLPIPPIGEQRAIANVLGTLDDKIELNRRMNQTLEAMARALYKDWFIDFGPVRAKMEGRQPPALSPEIAKLFPDSLDIKGTPQGWQERRIEDILELAYGKALKATERVIGQVPVYGSGGVTGYHNEHLVDGPSIVVGRKGTIGTLYWEDRSFFPIDTVFYVNPKAPLTFCFYLLESLSLKDMNTDAAVPGLNRNNVYRLQIPWASEALTAAFDNIVKPLRQQIYNNVEESRTLATLRDLLLPKLLSGEIRVKEAEQIAGITI